jgi:hypothetical protein
LPIPISVGSRLADASAVADGSFETERAADLATLNAAVDQRPDLKALDAAVMEAEAEVRLEAIS